MGAAVDLSNHVYRLDEKMGGKPAGRW